MNIKTSAMIRTPTKAIIGQGRTEYEYEDAELKLWISVDELIEHIENSRSPDGDYPDADCIIGDIKKLCAEKPKNETGDENLKTENDNEIDDKFDHYEIEVTRITEDNERLGAFWLNGEMHPIKEGETLKVNQVRPATASRRML